MRHALRRVAQRNVKALSQRLRRRLSDEAQAWVDVVEVGPRDGLQNEKSLVSVDTKVELIRRLVQAGTKVVEVGAFVSPKWVPQMADTAEVVRRLTEPEDGETSIYELGGEDVRLIALTPNEKGFEAAVAAGVDEVAVFGAASEAFSRRNVNCSIEESIRRFEIVCSRAFAMHIPVRGYVSTVLGCPYQGAVDAGQVIEMSKALLAMGCYEVSLGDTIGVGSAGTTMRLLEELDRAAIDFDKLAVHFHDTYGQSLANILVAVEGGITTVDAAVGGLGGCPYASGASGNVATEDVLYMLHGMGAATGIDLDKTAETGQWICDAVGRTSPSKCSLALTGARPP